jgi:hypothetical protein
MQPAIYPEHERIVEHQMAWGKQIDPLKTTYLTRAFDAAQDYFDPGGVFGDERARLAFRLYAAAQAQTNLKVRFINLVTVLEMLSRESARVGPLTIEVIKKLMKVVKDERAKYPRGHMETESSRDEMEKLLGKIGELKRKSITEQMCDYVYGALYSEDSLVGGAEPILRDVSDQRVREIYAVRGGLVHNGVVAREEDRSSDERFSDAFNRLHEMMPRLLLSELGKYALGAKTSLPETLLQRDHS